MACMWSPSAEDLTCAICKGVFRDPVLLQCGHNFCEACVLQWWGVKRKRECPCCKSVCTRRVLPRNLVLKNFCDTFSLEVDSGIVCGRHYEKFKLFCLDDNTPVCVVCKESAQHRDHRFVPVDEAADIHRRSFSVHLEPLRKKLNLCKDVKGKYEKADSDIESQAQDTEEKIRGEFRVLRDFLLTEENTRIAALREEEAFIRNAMKNKIADLTSKINTLESTIDTIEASLKEADSSLLLKCNAINNDVRRPLPDPEAATGPLINVAKHLGNMSFKVWHKMQSIVSHTPVILNPNTAHRQLHLSDGLTSVKCGPEQPLAETPERMEHHRSVLGLEGFTSGSHSWSVEVGDNPVWSLGVIAQDAQKMKDVASGLWMVRFCHGKFTAFSPTCQVSILPLKARPKTVRVHLDWYRGRLSFYDSDANTVIHTFTHTFIDKLFPYINTWNESIPLKILPMKYSITVTE
ncbi:zinc-binding protein A33-like [Parambassis ranga]|uniref:Zinc-binding protein A33-like n=1 Tax=Parambassis ranga TaxID=210632 RepID=A0A6P7HIA4_9TELE|nr:zinc-binding protein A33-like [Parambassis ranga]